MSNLIWWAVGKIADSVYWAVRKANGENCSSAPVEKDLNQKQDEKNENQ